METPKNELSVEEVAKIARHLIRLYCVAIDDTVPEQWERSTEKEKQSMIDGVKFHLNNDTSPEETHMSWVRGKVSDGWCYDLQFDPILKLHPCLVPYEQLPIEQRVKDHIFKGLVSGLKPFMKAD